MNKASSIGIFDSGIGGLTVVKKLKLIYPMKVLFILGILLVYLMVQNPTPR